MVYARAYTLLDAPEAYLFQGNLWESNGHSLYYIHLLGLPVMCRRYFPPFIRKPRLPGTLTYMKY
jgi:hypothetical protein